VKKLWGDTDSEDDEEFLRRGLVEWMSLKWNASKKWKKMKKNKIKNEKNKIKNEKKTK
jgi:hypothetical protein